MYQYQYFANLDKSRGLPPAPRPMTVKQGSLRILVVEDNEDAGDILKVILMELGHDVYLERDGLSGYEAALELDPDVILMDIGLPGIDGYETTRRIRSHGQDDTMIVALSAWGREADIKLSAASGMNYHLVKPLDVPALTDILKTVRPHVR